ncbi:MAG TPA: hypothetical protein PKM17_13010 [Syntrophorhabdus sp.]|nr:hypothetical protein [Syntrophorhabdus sp.]
MKWKSQNLIDEYDIEKKKRDKRICIIVGICFLIIGMIMISEIETGVYQIVIAIVCFARAFCEDSRPLTFDAIFRLGAGGFAIGISLGMILRFLITGKSPEGFWAISWIIGVWILYREFKGCKFRLKS